jgi:hypothetical protein
MRRQSDLHVIGARFKCRQQVAMAPFEILEHFGQLAGGSVLIQSEDTIHDMIRTGLVERIQVPWFGRRPERPYKDPCGVRPQMEGLPVQR